MANKFVDYINGNNANDASSYAQRRQQVSGTSVSAGDVIRIAKSLDPTNSGITATFTDQSISVTLGSALTTTVDLCETAWSSDDASITCDVSTTRKQGSQSCSFAVDGAFGTGLAAHKDLGGAIDVSSREQLSFLIRSDTQIAASSLALNLCSDTGGTVTVDAFTIPYQINANSWHFITVDKGSALGSTINSVALEVLIDLGGSTVNILLDDILACNASDADDCLTLNTLVATASSGPWYGLKSISGTSAALDQDTNSGVGVGRGFCGDTDTYTLWLRQPILYPLTSSDSMSTSAAANSPIVVSGGWDTADSMTTQNGETFVDLIGGTYNGIVLSGTLYNYLEKLSFVRGDFPCRAQGYYQKWDNCQSSNFKQGSLIHDGGGPVLSEFNNCNFICSTGIGLQPSSYLTTNNCNIFSNSSDGLDDGSGSLGSCYFVNTSFANNGGRSINIDQTASNSPVFAKCDFTRSASAPQVHRNGGYSFYGCSFDKQIDVAVAGANGAGGYKKSAALFKDCTIEGFTELFDSSNAVLWSDNKCRVENLNGTLNNSYQYEYNAKVSPGTDPDKWKLTLIGDGNLSRGYFWKYQYEIIIPYLEANKSTTITLDIKREDTNVDARFIIYAGSMEGIDTNILANVTASSDGAYETLTLDSFTPTLGGSMSIFVECWPTAPSTTSYVYLKEVTVTQV